MDNLIKGRIPTQAPKVVKLARLTGNSHQYSHVKCPKAAKLSRIQKVATVKH